MSATAAHIAAVGTAVPPNDIHKAFVEWAEQQLADHGDRTIFHRMARRAGIQHRWSILPHTQEGGSPVAPGGFYEGEVLPSTSARMALYRKSAPQLALRAIQNLAKKADIRSVSHLVVASCTGFVAPGIDQIIAAELGLDCVERTLVGFMGCYAAVAALRLAHHIVRSSPEARVLVVTVELSTIHLQSAAELEPLLAMLQFGDGAAAALVAATPKGAAILRPFAVAVPNTADLLSWNVGDQGFEMHLSGQLPGTIARALAGAEARRTILSDRPPDAYDAWAVHAGGTSVLDAVESAFGLAPQALEISRSVLRRFGNMSSSTLMFALADLLEQSDWRRGVALAFGPGLVAEGFGFERAA